MSPIPARREKTSSNHDEWYREILKSSMRLTQRQGGQLQINSIQYDVLPTLPSNLPPCVQRIFCNLLTQGLNSGLPHCRQILHQLSHKWNPRILEGVAYPFSSRSSWPRNRIKVLHCRQILYQLRDQESPSQSSQVDNSYPLPHPHKRAKSPNSNFPWGQATE